MCISDVVNELTARGITAKPWQVRWAILTGKVPRPPMDGSRRFNFAEEHVAELETVFSATRPGGVGAKG